MRSRVRRAEGIKAARDAGYEKVSLILGRAVQNVIRSRRAILATRMRLAVLAPDHQKNPVIGPPTVAARRQSPQQRPVTISYG
jgi:hypothetical protein